MTVVSLLCDVDDDVDDDESESIAELKMLVGCDVMYDVVIRMFVSD